jgi:hypothetical protein
MKIFYACAVRWKVDGSSGPVWHTETWLVKAISISDAEKVANDFAEQDDYPEFEVRSATPSNIRKVIGDEPVKVEE